MTEDQILRDRLWSVFRLLEMANMEAMRTKRLVGLIASLNPSKVDDVDLVPCRFHIDGHTYGAMVTAEQQNLILEEIGKGTAQDVLIFIATNLLEGHLYLAVDLVYSILVKALKNEDLMPLMAKIQGLPAPAATSPLGACMFQNGNCQNNCGAPLCKTLGGKPIDSCSFEGGNDDSESDA